MAQVADLVEEGIWAQGGLGLPSSGHILIWDGTVGVARWPFGPANWQTGWPHGGSRRRLSARDLHTAAGKGAFQGPRFSHALSQGRLYERRRKLARTPGRQHRIHDAAAAQRGLAARFRFEVPILKAKAGTIRRVGAYLSVS